MITKDAHGLDYWEHNATRYDVSTRLISGPTPRMLALVRQRLAGSGRVLEVAAGTGLVTAVLASVSKQVIATDYSTAMLERLQEKMATSDLGNVATEPADLYALPFPDASFDAVVAANVLHLVPQLPTALAELTRVLRPGGLLVVPTYCHAQNFVASCISRVLALTGFPGARRFSLTSLVRAVGVAGLRVESQECIPGLLPVAYVDGRKAT